MLGYCANVHPGQTLDEAIRQLHLHAGPVRAHLGWDALPVGLWLPAGALAEALSPAGLNRLKQALAELRLTPYTLNAFPYGHFHADVVKHAVYQPTWADPARYAYTLNACRLLAALLPEGHIGTVSTVPLGWPPVDISRCATQLQKLAIDLDQLRKRTGVTVRVALEPEPGCAFDRAEHVAEFFTRHLLTGRHAAVCHEHLGVCHDVCHSAVMREPQTEALDTYRKANVRIVKAQLSSALAVDFDALDTEQRETARTHLQGFVEPRWLHQTTVHLNGNTHFHQDLPQALQAHDAEGQWRVHFHVPLFAEKLDLLHTTQADVRTFLQALQPGECDHLEVETYAWHALPEAHRPSGDNWLSQGIAHELTWVSSLC